MQRCGGSSDSHGRHIEDHPVLRDGLQGPEGDEGEKMEMEISLKKLDIPRGDGGKEERTNKG